VPVLLDSSADIASAVAQVVEGKKFDYGTVCSSEQAIVAEENLRSRIVEELKARKAYLCGQEQAAALARLLITPGWTVNPKCVGQPPAKIARMAGFDVPPDTSILVVEIHGVGKEHPLSAEKLSPVLSLYFRKDFEACVEACAALLKFGGLGHTCVIHSTDEARIRYYGMRMPAFRVLVNTPAPQGSTGITTNVFPSMTLGCGAMAGNITGDNVGPEHLRNIKRIAYAVRKPEEAFEIPPAAPPEVASVDRGSVAAAVERYLTRRGIAAGGRGATSAPEAPPPDRDAAAAVVDRFLNARRTARPPDSPAPGCGCDAPAPAAPSDRSAAAPKPSVADFVCEYDVREALRAQRKIYIGAKTIVTPSARELAGAHDILVRT
jgi:acetaldehyde dehydrogenase (acetylating)